MANVTVRVLVVAVISFLIGSTRWDQVTARPWQYRSAGLPVAQAAGSLCMIAGQKTAAPIRAPLGATRSVTLTLQSQCVKRQGVVAYAFCTADHYEWPRAFRSPTQSWFQHVDLTHLELAFVGNSGGGLEVLAPLTSGNAELLSGLAKLSLEYNDWVDVTVPDAIHMATDELLRAGPQDWKGGYDQFILVVMQWLQGGLAGPAREEAERAKNAGVGVYVVSVNGSENRVLASSARHWFPYITPGLDDFRSFHSAYGRARRAIEQSVAPHLLTSAIVTDTLPANMRYIGGSANPPAFWDPAARMLSWQFPAPLMTSITVTYQIEPLECGTWPTNVQARAEAVDNAGITIGHTYPIPSVDVICASPTPEPSPTLTATRTPTVTPTSTATATPLRGPVYLPLALAEACSPGRARIDVALAIDASTSMLQPTAAGRTKLAAAVDAVAVFLDQLRFAEGEQAAIAAFSADAHLLQGLTDNRGDLDRALATVQPAIQTCLVCAVDVAADELVSERHKADNVPVLILLTDGKSNPRPVSEAVARAAAAKADGIVVFTIGLGEELDPRGLDADRVEARVLLPGAGRRGSGGDLSGDRHRDSVPGKRLLARTMTKAIERHQSGLRFGRFPSRC